MIIIIIIDLYQEKRSNKILNKIKRNNSFKRHKGKVQKNTSHNSQVYIYNKKSEPRLRGKPSELKGKYEILARDASSAGDKIAAENYMQHAEHFLRINNLNKKEE